MIKILSAIAGPCFCEAHLGDMVRQVTVELDGGMIAIVQEDGAGTHYWMGCKNGIGKMRMAFPWEVPDIRRAIESAASGGDPKK